MDAQDLKNALADFYGSEKFYRHNLNRSTIHTEGVKFFAENAGCYWLLDIIATEPKIQQCMLDHGAIITLNVDGTKGTITVRKDSDEPAAFTRKLNYTDAPQGEWKFFFFNNVIMLPSEY